MSGGGEETEQMNVPTHTAHMQKKKRQFGASIKVSFNDLKGFSENHMRQSMSGVMVSNGTSPLLLTSQLKDT